MRKVPTWRALGTSYKPYNIPKYHHCYPTYEGPLNLKRYIIDSSFHFLVQVPIPPPSNRQPTKREPVLFSVELATLYPKPISEPQTYVE